MQYKELQNSDHFSSLNNPNVRRKKREGKEKELTRKIKKNLMILNPMATHNCRILKPIQTITKN